MEMALPAPDIYVPAAPDCSGEDEQPDWCDLAENCCEPNPFYHPALLRPALDLLDAGDRIELIEVPEGGRLIALMPVAVHPRHSRYPVRNSANWMHDQCFYGAPLLRRGQEEQAWSGLLARLDAAPWAGQFLHLSGLDLDGPAASALRACCAAEGRGLKRIAGHERALLCSGLSAEAYWQTHVRPKKRKELRRLASRLAEAGTVTHRRLDNGADVAAWAEDFLELEASGWKGRHGAPLGASERTRAWFNRVLAGAAAADLLDMLRIDLDGRAIAMLVNFRHGRGGFSYKIAFDERFARYSPGILVEIDNLHAVLGEDSAARPLDWMDSCAAANHPMIEGLWAERRRIGQFRVELKGHGFTALKRAAAYQAIGLAEQVIGSIRKKSA